MIKNVKDIEVGQKVYYVMLRDGKYQMCECEIAGISYDFLTEEALSINIDIGIAQGCYSIQTVELFDDIYDATQYAKKLNRIIENGTTGQIAKVELVEGYDNRKFGSSQFTKQLREQIDEYQNDGYYVEVQFSQNNTKYLALVIAREQ